MNHEFKDYKQQWKENLERISDKSGQKKLGNIPDIGLRTDITIITEQIILKHSIQLNSFRGGTVED